VLRSWVKPPSGYGDFVANFLLYVPLGFFGALALRGGRATRLCVMTMAGFVLSTGIELVQFYDAGRGRNNRCGDGPPDRFDHGAAAAPIELSSAARPR
jgi:hypothetical protein